MQPSPGRRVVAAVLPAHSAAELARVLDGAGFDVAAVDDVASLALQSGPGGPDVAVLDGDRLESPLRVLADLRAHASLAWMPAVVVGRSAAHRVAALRTGADDFVLRPYDEEDLVERLHGMVRRARTLRSMSPLTGLPGNVEIDTVLGALVADPAAEFAVLYADLDNFKRYNDAHGFAFGDSVLCATASLLREALAAHPTTRNFLGHLGGDDFVLVTGTAQAEPLCRDIVSRFDAAARRLRSEAPAPPAHLHGSRARRRPLPALSISIGVATTEHRSMSSLWEVSAVATEMKHRAKSMAGSAVAVDRRHGWSRMAQPEPRPDAAAADAVVEVGGRPGQERHDGAA